MNTLRALFNARALLLALLLLVGAPACAFGAGAPSEPTIVLEPREGGAGTKVTVRGSGFPAHMELDIRLGPPDVGASPQAYAVTSTGADGSFATSFILPNAWPDGRLIDQETLLVIALNSDGSVKATAPFTFRSSSNPETTGKPGSENGLSPNG